MGKYTKHIVIMRLSAMGDVAMCYPVLKALAGQHPAIKVTFISRPYFQDFFADLPNVHFFPVDLKERHQGIKGLYHLFKDIKALDKIDAFADFHDVIRSKIVRTFFRIQGYPVAVIDKGRKGKKALTRRHNKVLTPLKHSTERYGDVLRTLGIDISLDHSLHKNSDRKIAENVASLLEKAGLQPKIGIAPFAFHRGKRIPLEKIENLIEKIHTDIGAAMYLFGGGAEEMEKINQLTEKYPYVTNAVAHLNLYDELQLIGELDVMISMDSANMHLASMQGVPVLSIWGSTHQYAGFLGYGQSPAHIVEISPEALPCRPCSVFGNKPCFRGDCACMERIEVAAIMDKLHHMLATATDTHN